MRKRPRELAGAILRCPESKRRRVPQTIFLSGPTSGTIVAHFISVNEEDPNFIQYLFVKHQQVVEQFPELVKILKDDILSNCLLPDLTKACKSTVMDNVQLSQLNQQYITRALSLSYLSCYHGWYDTMEYLFESGINYGNHHDMFCHIDYIDIVQENGDCEMEDLLLSRLYDNH